MDCYFAPLATSPTTDFGIRPRSLAQELPDTRSMTIMSAGHLSEVVQQKGRIGLLDREFEDSLSRSAADDLVADHLQRPPRPYAPFAPTLRASCGLAGGRRLAAVREQAASPELGRFQSSRHASRLAIRASLLDDVIVTALSGSVRLSV